MCLWIGVCVYKADELRCSVFLSEPSICFNLCFSTPGCRSLDLHCGRYRWAMWPLLVHSLQIHTVTLPCICMENCSNNIQYIKGEKVCVVKVSTSTCTPTLSHQLLLVKKRLHFGCYTFLLNSHTQMHPSKYTHRWGQGLETQDFSCLCLSSAPSQAVGVSLSPESAERCEGVRLCVFALESVSVCEVLCV